ncbi:MAG: hypothetical protein CFE29_29550 [Bradyrhizobiaceae bacterium PARB1]|jgi:hypothetical protein|nr:MAG: hypothetical protein CFE29_29550 [Bradyrhizobiaceae bacterium PARB1]
MFRSVAVVIMVAIVVIIADPAIIVVRAIVIAVDIMGRVMAIATAIMAAVVRRQSSFAKTDDIQKQQPRASGAVVV